MIVSATKYDYIVIHKHIPTILYVDIPGIFLFYSFLFSYINFLNTIAKIKEEGESVIDERRAQLKFTMEIIIKIPSSQRINKKPHFTLSKTKQITHKFLKKSFQSRLELHSVKRPRGKDLMVFWSVCNSGIFCR